MKTTSEMVYELNTMIQFLSASDLVLNPGSPDLHDSAVLSDQIQSAATPDHGGKLNFLFLYFLILTMELIFLP